MIRKILLIGFLLLTIVRTNKLEANYFVVNTTADSGPGSLRWAITNGNFRPSYITFDIPSPSPQIIELEDELPPITCPQNTLNATQGGSPIGIVLKPKEGYTLETGLVISSNYVSIQGFSLTNFVRGIVIDGGKDNSIVGNYIGIDPDGLTAAGNTFSGVMIHNGTNNIIGGATVNERNIISGNYIGVYIDADAYEDSYGNQILGNFVGTDSTGKKAVPNTQAGIVIRGDTGDNKVGDSVLGTGNVISGNSGYGIDVDGSSSNLIQGNIIGADVTGTILLPNSVGILIDSANNTIGGLTAGSGNLITHNTEMGIVIGSDSTDNSTTGNSIISNSIYRNRGLGVNFGDTGIITPNHPISPTPGPNNFQNYPVLNNAIVNANTTLVSGILLSVPNSDFIIQFFFNARNVPNVSEGQTLLKNINISTDDSGYAKFTKVELDSIPDDSFLSATATRLEDGAPRDTSEFSPNFSINRIIKKVMKIKEILGN